MSGGTSGCSPRVLAGVAEPDGVVVFYPTRYDVEAVAASIRCPVAAFFAGEDVLPGATPADARALKDALSKNDEVYRSAPPSMIVEQIIGVLERW